MPVRVDTVFGLATAYSPRRQGRRTVTAIVLMLVGGGAGRRSKG
ncbi:hypothetical protein [Streptomyces sp. NPDC058297]